MVHRKIAASSAIVASITVLGLAVAACSSIPEYDPNAPSTRSTELPPASQPTTVDPRPTAPPAPEPAVAKVGQSIKVSELGNVKLSSYDPPKWAAATITLVSFKTMKAVPGIKFGPGPHKIFALADLRTTITGDPFTLYDQHFQLVAPDGTKYPQDANVAYLPNAFRDSHSSKVSGDGPSSLGPAEGVLLFDVPASGVPAGTKLTAEVWKDRPFSWLVS
jgi:hypothetical protein